MSKDTIKAKIGFLFFIPTELNEGKPLNITKNFLSGTSEKAQALDDIKVVEDFLIGSGAKFPHNRYHITGPTLSIPDATSDNTDIIVTDFYDAGVVGLCINANLEVTSVDQLIYIRQIFMTPVAMTEDGRSIPKLANDILAPLDLAVDNSQFAYLLEINEYFGEDDVEKVLENEKNAIYGIMTGDEGYEYLAKDMADNRLTSSWSTREYAKAFIFQNNFMLMHFNNTKRMKEYQERQTFFGNKFHGGVNPFFFLDAKVAGVNQGFLFSIEVGMVAKTISSYILDGRIARANLRQLFTTREIRRIKELRKDLILTLNRMEKVGISEVDELDHMIIEGLDVDPLVDKIKYLLELLESELDLLYQTRTNTFVNILTILGLVLTFINLIVLFI